MSDFERLQELYYEAMDLPEGQTKVSLLMEAVGIADSLKDVNAGYALRDHLMEAATFSGRDDLLIVSFTWNLAQFDKHPDHFDEYDLLWKYKWVIGNVSNFPDVKRHQILSMMDDMEKRYLKFGSTLHAVWGLRRDTYLQLGEMEQADESHARYLKIERDMLSDCPACAAGSECDYHVTRGRWKKAMAAVEKVLARNMTCAEEPHRTYSRVLYPLLRLGEREKAADYQQRGAKLIAKSGVEFLRSFARQLEYLSLMGEFAKAKRVLERRLPESFISVDLDSRMRFLRSSWLYCICLQDNGTERLKVVLSGDEQLPKADVKGQYSTEELGNWFRDRALEIARRFDARNGNSTFTDLLQETPELFKWAKKNLADS